MSAVLDSAIDAILTVDQHGVIQSVNRATIKLFGYQEKELIGTGLSQLLHESDRPSFEEDLSQYLRGEGKTPT